MPISRQVSVLVSTNLDFWYRRTKFDWLYVPLENILFIWRRQRCRCEKLQNLGLCSTHIAFENGGIFIWHIFNDTWPLRSHPSERSPHLFALYDKQGVLKTYSNSQSNSDPHVQGSVRKRTTFISLTVTSDLCGPF